MEESATEGVMSRRGRKTRGMSKSLSLDHGFGESVRLDLDGRVKQEDLPSSATQQA